MSNSSLAFALIGNLGSFVRIPVIIEADISLASGSDKSLVAVARHPSIGDEPAKLTALHAIATIHPTFR